MDIVVDIVDNHFNPRLREGGDFSSLSSVDGETISIHASAKEATMVGCIYRHFKGISIHASAKEATVYNGTIDWKKVKFQSTPPRRRRPDFLFFLHGHDYFNPRLREGGDISIFLNAVEIDISIHASAKEATNLSIGYCYLTEISIHASAKEATATYCDTSAIMYISSLNNFFVHFF